MSKLIRALSTKFRLNAQLAALFFTRLKMMRSAKQYAAKHPNGTIRYLDVFKDFQLSSIDGENVILFVVYAPNSPLMYERFFQLLEKLNYKIIVLSNSPLSDEFVATFKDRTILMAQRENIGRDFGGYKEFICELTKNNITPKNLVICNDSVFANVKKDDNRFVEFFQNNADEDFVGVAEYFGTPAYHVQSYFLKFSNNVLKAKNFIKFWDDFLPIDDRRINIHEGEIKLSASIIKDGFQPTVFLSTDKVINSFIKDQESMIKFITEIEANMHIDSKKVDLIKAYRLSRYDEETPVSEEHIIYQDASIKKEISRMINPLGMIVTCPFFIIDELGFPFLKRDLVYRQVTEWMLIRDQGKNFDQDLLDEYIKDQRLKKRAWNLSSLKDKLMYQTGMN